MLYVKIYSRVDNSIEHFESSIVDIVDFAYENPEEYPFLSSIDYYWVTYFSFQQTKERLIPELLKVSKSIQFKEKIDELIEYTNNNMDYHRFLKIIWD